MRLRKGLLMPQTIGTKTNDSQSQNMRMRSQQRVDYRRPPLVTAEDAMMVLHIPNHSRADWQSVVAAAAVGVAKLTTHMINRQRTDWPRATATKLAPLVMLKRNQPKATQLHAILELAAMR